MNPIQFYTSVDVTLSEKLLEIMYCLIGLISIYVAFKNLKDKENKNNVGNVIKLRNDGFEGNTKNVLLFFYGKFEFFC